MIRKIEQLCIWFLLWRIKKERIEMADKRRKIYIEIIRTMQNLNTTTKMVVDRMAVNQNQYKAAASRLDSINVRIGTLLSQAEELEKEELRAEAIKEAEAIEAARRVKPPAKKAPARKALTKKPAKKTAKKKSK